MSTSAAASSKLLHPTATSSGLNSPEKVQPGSTLPTPMLSGLPHPSMLHSLGQASTTPRSARSAVGTVQSVMSMPAMADWAEVFAEAEESESVAAAALESIVSRAWDKVHRRELQEQIIPFVALQAKADILQLLRGLNIKRDYGDSVVKRGEWSADDEPRVCFSDAHSRGVIPMAVRPHPPENVSAELPSAPPSRKSYLRRASPGNSSRKLLAADGKAPLDISQSGEAKSLLSTLHEPSSSHGSLASKGTHDIRNLRTRIDSEKKHAEVVKARLLAQEKEEQEHLNRLRSELRGKEYTYDIDGKIILINNVAPDKLPKNKLDVKVNVVGPATEPQMTETQTQSRRVATLRKKVKAAAQDGDETVSSASKKDSARDTFFKETVSVPMTNPNSINVVPGVILREGTLVRTGPKKPTDAHRMSKKDFEALQSGGSKGEKLLSDKKPDQNANLALPKLNS